MKKYVVFISIIVGIFALALLANSIETKEVERKALNQTSGVPAEPGKSSDWKQFYPKQYETWKKTSERKEYVDMFDIKPKVAILRAGEDPTGAWWGHGRGHWYSNLDLMFNIITGTPKDPKYLEEWPPSRCLMCHSGDVLRLINRDGKNEFYSKPMSYYAHEAQNPIGCQDCHDPKTAELSVKRDYLNKALVSAGLPDFDHSTHQQKRSLVCAQCHVLSYTTKEEWTDKEGKKQLARTITLPWAKGLSVEETEAYYDDPKNFPDGKPAVHIENIFSKAPTILAEHPDYELYQKGTHAKNGVACADCHLPYTQEGGVKFSHHNIGNPLDKMDQTCLTCHKGKEQELKGIVNSKREKVTNLSNTALDNLSKAHLEAAKAWEAGATEKEMASILKLIRKAQWRWSYVDSSFGAYFHATEESLRIFADANEYAQQARLELVKILANHGVKDYIAPEFKTKEEVFKYMNIPEREQLIKEKCEWIKTTGKKWLKEAKENGTISEDVEKKDDIFTWFDHMCK